MLIGYARCSTQHQRLDRQIEALTNAGCSTIYQEKASGKDLKQRPQMEKAITSLKEGDILVLAEWDRATRSMMDGINIIQRIADQKALVKVLDKHFLDLTTPIGQGVLALLSALAQDERQRICERAASGIRLAKERGVKFGPKFKLTTDQVREITAMIEAGRSMTECARLFGVHPSTVSRLNLM